jgi:hypothetical protein
VTGVCVSWAAGLEGGVPKLVLPAGAKRPPGALGVDAESLAESLETEGTDPEKSVSAQKDEKVEVLSTYEVLDAIRIPAWADAVQERGVDVLEGFANAAARDESRAWTALLEGVVRSVLVCTSLNQPEST